MNYLIAGLAVYKFVQLIDALTPKEAMPWVKILFSVVVSYITTLFMPVDHIVVAGLAISAIAGIVHAVLRFMTLTGDWAQRKSAR